MGTTLNQVLLGVGENHSQLLEEKIMDINPGYQDFLTLPVPRAGLSACVEKATFPLGAHKWPLEAVFSHKIPAIPCGCCRNLPFPARLGAAACPWEGASPRRATGAAGRGLFIAGVIFAFPHPDVFLPDCL